MDRRRHAPVIGARKASNDLRQTLAGCRTCPQRPTDVGHHQYGEERLYHFQVELGHGRCNNWCISAAGRRRRTGATGYRGACGNREESIQPQAEVSPPRSCFAFNSRAKLSVHPHDLVGVQVRKKCIIGRFVGDDGAAVGGWPGHRPCPPASSDDEQNGSSPKSALGRLQIHPQTGPPAPTAPSSSIPPGRPFDQAAAAGRES